VAVTPSVTAHAAVAHVTSAVGGSPSQQDRLGNPGAALSSGWRHSPDKIVTVQGDESGLHVLLADESTGYAWQTIATLGDPGVETSMWIGQACLTGDGRYAVVVYAPREVTNMAEAMGVLGRVAIVDLGSGAVRQVGGGYSVAYFDPGCGTADQVVLTRGGWGGDTPALPATTGLQLVNAATGATSLNVTVPGQATSAVPYQGTIAAAYGRGISQITGGGRTRLLTPTSALPFRLVPDGAGGLGFETQASGRVGLHRLAGGRVSQLGSVAAGSVQLSAQGGKVWVTGNSSSALRGLPAGWRSVPAPAGSLVSTTGQLVATSVSSVGQRHQRPGDPQPVLIQGQLLTGSHAHVKFTVPTASGGVDLPRAGGASLTSFAGPRVLVAAATAGSGTTPVSADRTCGVALDDPTIQAYQPDFSQVEWAADQAVQGTLTGTRPAGLYGSALPSYTPQGMFSLPELDGGGTIPAQVLLGVLTQESNLEQASVHVIQGQASNPLTSFNWYGNWIDSFTVESNTINWSAADCGYGIGQVTSGMCISQNANDDPECEYTIPLSATDQLAVAVDYQANIADTAKWLADYWNQLQAEGMPMNGGVTNSANYIENWYMALWAYNSGFEPGTSTYGNTTGCTPSPTCTDGNGDWGLGYADNPANPAYPPDRPVFPDSAANNTGYPAPGGGAYSPSWDLSHPQYWTYQEKVISWAFDSVTLWDYNKQADVQAFAYAHGNATYPPTSDFCNSSNNCTTSVLSPTSATSNGDACQLTGSYVDHCWWHSPVTWNGTCTSSVGACGTSVLTYSAGASDPGNPTIASEFAPDCTLGSLPSSAVIVGADQAALGCPGQNWTSAGSMTWSFGEDTSNGTYPSKIYFDQIGAGFGGHFWFGYTIPNDQSATDPTDPASTNPSASVADLEITGTWPAPASVSGWTNILVHIPSYGAWDPQANYQINPGGSQSVEHSVVNQAQQANTWVSLGVFDLSSGAAVSLSNVTYSGLGWDIAWNGLAFVPASGPNTDYVALGDSYSAGEGVEPYDADSDYSYNGMVNNCHRSTSGAYPRMVTLPGQTTPIAQQAANTTSGTQFHFVACSGAETPNVDQSAIDVPPTEYDVNGNTDWGGPDINPNIGNQDGELTQTDQGYLTSQTTLVTLTIGGNDIRFADVLTGCILTLTDCISPGYALTRSSNGAVDPDSLIYFEPEVINLLQSHLESVYEAISSLAPNAEIIVIGYPELFPSNPQSSCLLGLGLFMNAADQAWLNQMGTQLNQTIQNSVNAIQSSGVNIHFINPTSAFTGHEICSSDPWINGLITWSNSGSGLKLPGSGSFHPMLAGQQEYADLVNGCLAGTISC
jgi:hypothetical protein